MIIIKLDQNKQMEVFNFKYYIILIFLFLDKIIYSQQTLPVQLTINYNIKKNVCEISIIDSTDFSISDESAANVYEKVYVKMMNGTIDSIHHSLPAYGYEPIDSPNWTNYVVKNQSYFQYNNVKVLYNINKDEIELFIYFEEKEYGYKTYYLQGRFITIENGFYKDFVPYKLNFVKSSKADYLYYFEKDNKVFKVNYPNQDDLIQYQKIKKDREKKMKD